MISSLKKIGVTVVLTAECTEDQLDHATGIEEFVADNVIILASCWSTRGAVAHWSFSTFAARTTNAAKCHSPHWPTNPAATRDNGWVVIPRTAHRLTQESSTVRMTGRRGDGRNGGGFFRDSVILVFDAAGAGKRLTTEFLNGAKKRRRGLLFAFEESRDQLYRNRGAWGMDFDSAEDQGRLNVVNQDPHALPMEEHLAFRACVISLASLLKEMRVTALCSSTTASLLSGESVTEKHTSTLTDSILLLRYWEVAGPMRHR